MIPLVMSTFGKLCPSAESYLQSLADVACSTACVDRGVWLRIAKQFLSCALVRGRGIVFRHFYKMLQRDTVVGRVGTRAGNQPRRTHRRGTSAHQRRPAKAVTTTRGLRSVLDNIFVMVLLCHSNACGCFVCST